MCQTLTPIYFWPESIGCLPKGQNLLVIAVLTPQTNLRASARVQIREALKQALAEWLNCTVDDFTFISELGKPLKFLHPNLEIWLSISHESGLSIAAINRLGRVGIDLMLIDSAPKGDETYVVATEYFGKNKADEIASLPFELQKQAFAQSWTALEARFKCQEQQIVEWHLSKSNSNNFLTQSLALPEGYTGNVVTYADTF
ncbi:MAG: hypothetical protein WBP13_02465 [Methylophilaceae bacterium]